MADGAELDLRVAEAFRDFGALALWSMREVRPATPGHARVIARALRVHGGHRGRRLANQIEDICDARTSGEAGCRFAHARFGDNADVTDSDFHFFPVIADDEFGHVLHPIDLATNKLTAAAERREARDAVDLVTIARLVLPLGPLAWAAAEKNPGRTPEELLADIRRRACYHDDEVSALALEQPIAASDLNNQLRALLDEAESFVAAVPRMLDLGLILDGAGGPVRSAIQLTGELRIHHGVRKGSRPAVTA